MNHRFKHATAEIERARDMVRLGQSIQSLSNMRIDPSDIYRASIVQAVSAMDHYFHGIVIDRAVDMILGRNSSIASTSGKVGLTFDAVREIAQAEDSVDKEMAARKHAAARMSRETLQNPDDIAKALGMVGVQGVWGSAFPTNSKSVKTALGVTLTRRNRIAHQSDGDPLNPGEQTPIDHDDALSAIQSVEAVIVGIDPLC